MSRAYIQDPKTQIWHLAMGVAEAPEGVVDTWCGVLVTIDDPQKTQAQMTFEDIQHDECYRKAEELDD